MFAAILAAPLAPAVQQTSQPWPGPRAGGHALAFDSRRGLTMLYGDRGADATTLWGWDGRQWTAFTAAGPALRRHIKLAYDAGRDRLVLFGGLDDSGRTFMGDTWEWDGTQWTRAAEDGPSPRASYSMIYDAARLRVLLFGGLSPDGAKNDLWSWDGRRWTKLADGGPSPRGEAGMIRDPVSGFVLVTAGTGYEQVQSSDGRPTPLLQRSTPPRDTWAWDGSGWTKLAGEGDARSFTALVNDPLSGRPLRIGGESPDGYQGDLSQWTGRAWALVPDATIPPRHGLASALDTRRKRVVIFGGSSGSSRASQPLGDLWEWDGSHWIEVAQPPR